ncbi:MAG: hypothetical protein IPQ09_29400 [Myxococcales bacterium]|nr:hypothetical protein [Myxococcales bacterium]HQY62163.1 hypothetical protein [Polyangiaceae bacterium]
MCCFSLPVRFVGGTRIFARSAELGRQWLVYAMNVELDEELAMVLPLPVPPSPGDDAVSFVDLSGYASFFTHLEAAFPPDWGSAPQAKGLMRSAPSRRPLAVVEVGEFEASFVPRRADFRRLDRRFRLSDAVWARLDGRSADHGANYADWGFAVFQLRPRRAGFLGRIARQTVHPMAFTFPTREPGALFFPTLHVHDGHLPARASFDHMLFCQSDGALDAALPWDTSAEPLEASVSPARARGAIAAGRRGRRTSLQGELPNRDVVVRPPTAVRAEDLEGKGETYSYCVHATSLNLFAPEDALRRAWQRTARDRLPGLCGGLREGLRALTEARRDAWGLAPLVPSLPQHFVNGAELWTGLDYLTGAPAVPGGPGQVTMRVFTETVEPQDVTLGFARLPDQALLCRIRAELAVLVRRSVE